VNATDMTFRSPAGPQRKHVPATDCEGGFFLGPHAPLDARGIPCTTSCTSSS